jgi:hypothetical protein
VFGLTYSGKTDSTPTPATNLRNLKVVLIPALRLPSTIPLNVNSRRLFSGTCCSLIHRKDQCQKHIQTALKQEHKEMIYQSHLNHTSRLHIRNLPLRADLFDCLFFRICIVKQADLSVCGDFVTVTGCNVTIPSLQVCNTHSTYVHS